MPTSAASRGNNPVGEGGITGKGLLPEWLQRIFRRRHEFTLQPVADLAAAETPPGRWLATSLSPSSAFMVDQELVVRFRASLIARTRINAGFHSDFLSRGVPPETIRGREA